jgi:hypothetical protein
MAQEIDRSKWETKTQELPNGRKRKIRTIVNELTIDLEPESTKIKKSKHENRYKHLCLHIRGGRLDQDLISSIIDKIKSLTNRVEYNKKSRHLYIELDENNYVDLQSIISNIYPNVLIQESDGWKVVGKMRNEWPQKVVAKLQGSEDKTYIVSDIDALYELCEMDNVVNIWPMPYVYAR